MSRWRVVPLGDVAEVISGQSPPGDTYNETGEGMPFFQGKAEFGETHPIAKKWCTMPKKLAEAGDILISVRAPVGPTNVAAERCCIGRGLAAVRVDPSRADSEYMRFALRKIEPDLVKLGQGSTFPAINRKELCNALIPLPPLAEQRCIVDILNRAESIRRLRRQAQEKARQLIPAQFIDMFGNGLDLAKNWPVRPLREVADIRSGVTKGRKLEGKETVELPYLRVANVQDGHLDFSVIKTIPILPTEVEKFALQEGDLVMTEGGDIDKLGRAAIWRGEIDPCVHQNHVFRVRPDRAVVTAEYLQAAASSGYGRNYFLRVAKRTTGIASINKTQLGDLPVPVPPLALQERFSDALTDIRAASELSGRMQATADTLGASLAHSVFGGE